jgi:membrane-anchored protein YejM (alkaline phosphatase superfamily)
MDGLIEMLSGLPQPTFAYLHLMPPHEPYMPSRQFLGSFDDGWAPQEIKKHRLAPGVTQKRLDERRQEYDEYLANLDAEFGRLLDHMEKSGLLENSYVFLTSDHGELFERGAHGHSTPLLFEAVIRPPLLVPPQGSRSARISGADQQSRYPAHLLHMRSAIPDWAEGASCRGWAEEDAQRSIYAIDKTNAPTARDQPALPF